MRVPGAGAAATAASLVPELALLLLVLLGLQALDLLCKLLTVFSHGFKQLPGQVTAPPAVATAAEAYGHRAAVSAPAACCPWPLALRREKLQLLPLLLLLLLLQLHNFLKTQHVLQEPSFKLQHLLLHTLHACRAGCGLCSGVTAPASTVTSCCIMLLSRIQLVLLIGLVSR
jgi:hypothetical protein